MSHTLKNFTAEACSCAPIYTDVLGKGKQVCKPYENVYLETLTSTALTFWAQNHPVEANGKVINNGWTMDLHTRMMEWAAGSKSNGADLGWGWQMSAVSMLVSAENERRNLPGSHLHSSILVQEERKQLSHHNTSIISVTKERVLICQHCQLSEMLLTLTMCALGPRNWRTTTVVDHW